MENEVKKVKHKSISYAKWGYIFIAPFFIVYIIFQLIPLLSTFYYSFFESYKVGTQTVGPDFVGFKNYAELFTPNRAGTVLILRYLGNTMIMWILGAVPQLVFSLLLAVIYTSNRLKIKGQRFFKTVMYMPNLIMAAAFAMLFFQLFGNIGPINQIIGANGGKTVQFFNQVWTARGIIAFINFLMWFGNTTILLMAGIMGIDQSLFEAAEIDGATSSQVFWKITMPLLAPIMVYVAITSLIGGLQMYDVPQIIASSTGAPGGSTMTLIMYLNNYLNGSSRNLGMSGAISVLIFIITGVLSVVVYKSMVGNPDKPRNKKKGA